MTEKEELQNQEPTTQTETLQDYAPKSAAGGNNFHKKRDEWCLLCHWDIERRKLNRIINLLPVSPERSAMLDSYYQMCRTCLDCRKKVPPGGEPPFFRAA